MYKKILLLLDDSQTSERLVASVAELAIHENATVVLVRVLERPFPMIGPAGSMIHASPGWACRTEQEATTYLSAFQQRLESMGIGAVSRLAWGPTLEAVLALADSERVDLVAMTSGRPSCLSRLPCRNLAHGIFARCAVLVLPPSDDEPSVSHIK